MAKRIRLNHEVSCVRDAGNAHPVRTPYRHSRRVGREHGGPGQPSPRRPSARSTRIILVFPMAHDAIDIREFAEDDLEAVVAFSLQRGGPSSPRFGRFWGTRSSYACIPTGGLARRRPSARSVRTTADVYVAVAGARPVGFVAVALNAFHERIGVMRSSESTPIPDAGRGADSPSSPQTTCDVVAWTLRWSRPAATQGTHRLVRCTATWASRSCRSPVTSGCSTYAITRGPSAQGTFPHTRAADEAPPAQLVQLQRRCAGNGDPRPRRRPARRSVGRGAMGEQGVHALCHLCLLPWSLRPRSSSYAITTTWRTRLFSGLWGFSAPSPQRLQRRLALR